MGARSEGRDRVVQLVDRTLDLAAATVTCQGRSVSLTEREHQLVVYLVARPGERVSWEQIHREVWQHAPSVVSRAAYHAWRRMLPKLEADPANPVHFVGREGGVLYRPHRALSAEADDLVGRAQELQQIDEALRAARLVTLWGTAGVGKTRLALAHARLDGGARIGVVRCASEPVTEEAAASALCAAVAQALGLVLDESDPVEQVARALVGYGPLLLVLDELEGVAAHAGSILTRWLEAPDVRLLTTSRRPLGLPRERVLPVAPLPRHDAVELFQRRAQAAGAPRPAEAEVGALIELLDRLPLAIELCAPWARTLPVASLCQRMEARLELTAAGQQPRQGTLRASLTHSWDLLEPQARTALAQLSVFEGPFDARAAEAILAPDEGWEPLELLRVLVDASLLRRVGDRLGMLRGIRRFADEELDEVERGAVQRRHLEWFARSAARELATDAAADPHRLERLRAEQADRWVAAERGLGWGRVHEAAWCFLGARVPLQLSGPFGEGIALCGAILGALDDDPPTLAARLRTAEGWLLAATGRLQRAAEQVASAVEAYRASGDQALLARGLVDLSSMRVRLGDVEGADALCVEALSLLGGEATPTPTAAHAILYRGGFALLQGRLGDAERLLDEALGLYRASGSQSGEAQTLTSLGLLHGCRGALVEERRNLEGALALHRSVSARAQEADTLVHLSLNARRQGAPDAERVAAEQALRLHRQSGGTRGAGLALQRLASHHQDQGRRDDSEVAWREALHQARACGVRSDEITALVGLGLLLLEDGRLERSEALLRQAVAAARPGGPAASALAALGQIAARRGDGSAARGWVADAERMAASTPDVYGRADLWVQRAEVELLLGAPAGAREALAAARALVPDLVPGGPLDRALSRLERRLRQV